jgi:hypothetical protein
MRRRGALVLSVVALVLAVAPSAQARRPWHPPKPPPPKVSVEVVDGMGARLRTFVHHGQTFVLGNMGQRYAVRIANNTDKRLEVVLSVDGLDAVRGTMSNPMRDRGYVLSPRGMVTIEGFRTSMESVAAFRFSDRDHSLAAMQGARNAAVGSLRVLAFEEQPRVMMRPGAGRAKAAPRSSARRDNLGTEMGEERMSGVREVSFVRARMAPQVVSLRYDDAAGLRARGITVDRPMMRPPRPPMRHSRRH